MKPFILLVAVSCLIWGCRNNPNMKKEDLVSELTNEEKTQDLPKAVIDLPEYYTPPPGIESEAKIFRPTFYTSLDMQQVLKNERPAKLSDFGKELVYKRITEPIIDIRDIYSLPEGYLIAAYAGSIYLYDKDFRMVKKLIEEDLDVSLHQGTYWVYGRHVLSDMCYDQYSGLLFARVYEELSKNKSESYLGTIQISELIDSPEPIKSDGLKNKIQVDGSFSMIPIRNGYATLPRNSQTIYTFNTKGDTISQMSTVEADMPKLKRVMRGAESATRYTYNGYSYIRPPYTDCIYKIKDFNLFEATYKIDFGDKQVSPTDGPNPSVSLADKLLLDSWFETDDYILIRFTQDYDCPNNRERKLVKFHQAVYNKKTKEFYSFTNHKQLSEPYNIPNDIDNGIDFWPNRIIDGKPYMTIVGARYKEQLKTKPEHVPPFADINDIDDNEVILITIN